MKLQASILILVITLLVAACAPRINETSGVPSDSAALKSPSLSETSAMEPWQKKWEDTLKAAHKEGNVIIYSSEGAEGRQALTQAFKKRYQLDIEYVSSGRSSMLTQKIFTERRAGLYMVDAFISGSTGMVTELKPAGILDRVEPELILPDVTEPEKLQQLWFGGSLYFIDETTRFILSFSAYPSFPLAFNTEIVRPEEIRSYKDLLKPKFKEKIILSNPTIAGSGAKWFQIQSNYIMNLDYMKELAKQNPLIMDDLRLMADWIARGKYYVGIAPKPVEITEFQRAGAPVDFYTPVEGTYLTSGGGNIVIIKKRPNPNATRIFLNWLLTQEGQSIFTQVSERQSRRLDISLGDISQNKLRQAGAKYFESEKEDILIKSDESYKVAKEVFGSLMR